MHHGYWIDGTESKEYAQEQLTHYLARQVGITKGMSVLDVGCGMGGSSIMLARQYGAKTLGVTLSPSQVAIATKAAAKEEVDARFLVMDAEAAELPVSFDVIWTIEAVSHFSDPENFFRLASRALKPGGKIALIDWFQSDALTDEQEQSLIKSIKLEMLVPSMTTLSQYIEFAERNGFTVLESEDISENVAKSWDIGFKIASQPEVWKLALKEGAIVLKFIKAIYLMRKGFSSKAFRYGVLIAQKI